ncbi:2,3-bisphosphoglycerate-independent phosphoglycerate mutase [Elongatibacter sediminis]|uniref:2,3-bisphosphoglycerate-independent phosphoglycerate mutase n=1 Tax=Elongatibacter sediminis TaxID=3119006 RepID=A0AAW9RFE4_9GAMM
MQPRTKPLVLMILDGWGHRVESENNAIALAKTPCWDTLWSNDPHALLETSGAAVGLPDGQMGNSEVGHMNIGAGRIVYQDFTRISRAIEDGSFQSNAALCRAIDAARSRHATVHVMGLLSPGGVHSHESHFIETVRLAAQRGAPRVAVHAFLDGRDTPPRSARASLEAMQEEADRLESVSIDSVIGRYYAMDRDQRWDRVERAWHAIADGRAEHSAESAVAALEAAYEREENDEFVQPTVIGTPPGVRPGDSVIFVNFRADRARELSQAFVDPAFDGFAREPRELSAFVCMTEYLNGLPAEVAFPAETLPNLLGEVLARHGLHQLRLAETEKYAHVTFFLNGGREDPFPLEERVLIPSPRVATYDLQPEMSSVELTERLVDAIASNRFDVIICNVANPDMVGHSGKLEAAIQAVEAVDRVLARTIEAIDAAGGELLVTADHGNVEQMIDPETGQAHTAHTTQPVPLLYHGRDARMAASGSLRDIAPTLLYLLGIDIPAEMTGQPLIAPAGA